MCLAPESLALEENEAMMSPFKDDALANKRILVSGGGTGLGREITRGFAQHGATVYICGRRESVLAGTSQELRAETGRDIIPVVCNLRDHASVQAMAERIWGRRPAHRPGQ